jgi:hypothetical protein
VKRSRGKLTATTNDEAAMIYLTKTESGEQHGALLHDGPAADAVWRMGADRRCRRSSHTASPQSGKAALAMAEHLEAKLRKGYDAV